MIQVKVRLLGVLRGSSNKDEISLRMKQRTVRGAIQTVKESLPGPARSLLTNGYLNDPRSNVLILLNGKEIGVLKGLDTSIKDGDELTIIPVAHGG